MTSPELPAVPVPEHKSATLCDCGGEIVGHGGLQDYGGSHEAYVWGGNCRKCGRGYGENEDIPVPVLPEGGHAHTRHSLLALVDKVRQTETAYIRANTRNEDDAKAAHTMAQRALDKAFDDLLDERDSLRSALEEAAKALATTQAKVAEYGSHKGYCNTGKRVPFGEAARAEYFKIGCTCGFDAASRAETPE